MKNLLNKYAEIEARKRAERIECALAYQLVMPKWQYKLMLITKSRLLGKIFGYELRTYVDSNKFEIWKRGKKLYYSTY
jgi:hypothetical protein